MPEKKLRLWHKCELIENPEKMLPKPPPYAHAVRKRWYGFRHFLTIHKNYESQQYFRSQMSFMKEKRRHLGTPEYRFVIHPLSNFITAEQITYFFVDASPLVITTCLNVFSNIDYKIKVIVFQLTSLRLFRIKTAIDGMEKIFRFFRASDSFRIAFIIYFCCLLCIHWWTCFLKVINVVRDEYGIPYNQSWVQKVLTEKKKASTLSDDTLFKNPHLIDYVEYMTVVLCHFFGAGIGHYRTNDSFDMLILSFLLVFSMMFYLCSLGVLLQKLSIVNISQSKYEEVITHAKEYMVIKKYPPNLRRRISDYYKYKFNGNFFSEKVILDSLSEHLQMEILLYSCRNMVEKVQIFKGLSKAAVGCILALLKQEIYLPHDEIMRADEDSGTLYFILFGTCAVMLMSGKEAMHVEDGNLFGENRNFAKNVTQDFIYSIVALEPCEIYCLTKEDVEFCCNRYPEIAQKIETMCVTKARHYTNVLGAAAAEEETVSASDIVAELRKGRIIEQGLKRLGPLNIVRDF
ncbi:cNMP binding domain containing protein [Asbolus verrucosus]|uniref:cNMP binding domain containing protein n=1 Tax=Asbolus verrucosus TaxID=1661398 RepID=A0A482VEF9_ASBVE|nr:cNMP binding domain containing protein [Asbolus verrucosus]